MGKSPDAFRSIGEVSRLIGVAPHVLRYWESQFPQLSPVKRADGRRYYRPDDMRLAAGLCQVMREEGLSIRGAKRLIAADRGAGLRQIGAARLGENPGETGLAPPPAPAVRLALPEDGVDLPGEAGHIPAAAESRPPAASIALPDWLARLTGTAAGLRRHELAGTPLPNHAGKLRDALRQAR